MNRHTQKKHVKILAAVQIASASGRDILSGIFKFLEDHANWQFHLIQYSKDFLPEAVASAPENGFDGIMATFPGADGTLDALLKTPLPVVFVNVGFQDIAKRRRPCADVRNDNAAIGHLAATSFLKNRGYSSFAFVPANDKRWNVERGNAFRETLSRAGMQCATFSSAVRPDSPFEDGDGLTDFLSSLPKPAAVFAASDECAVRVLSVATAVGISVPDQMALLGVDNDEFLVRHSNPPISSILPGHVRMGLRAAQEMNALLKGRPRSRDPIFIPPVAVMERASTKPVLPAVALVRRAKAYIAAHGCERIDVTDIVGHLGVSRRLAELRFRQIEGNSLRQALEGRRIEEVKRLLAKTQLSVTAIAERTGFSGQNRLCHVFTERVGVSPTQYRTSR